MTWFIDDINLSTLAFNVENRAAGWKVPPKRGDNLVIPGRNGAQWVPNKPFDVGTLSLSMWAVGATESGSLPAHGDLRRQARDNLDKLTALFAQSHKLLNVVQVSSLAFGIQNSFPTPNFASAGDLTTSTYSNSILNPSMRKRTSSSILRNLFPNPSLVSVQSPEWQDTYENLVKDPTNKLNRSATETILTSNYWGSANYEEFTVGDTIGTQWTTATNTVATVQASTASDQSANPLGGTKLFRVSTSANLASNASLGSKFIPYIAPNFTPLLRFRYRRSGNTGTTRTFQVRVSSATAANAIVASGTWQTFSLGPDTTTWYDAAYDSGSLVVSGTAEGIRVEFRTGEAWLNGDNFIIDQAMVSLKGTSGHSTTGYFADIPSPFWDSDSAWASLRLTVSLPGPKISRWDYKTDSRWVSVDPTNDTGAYFAAVDRPQSDPTGTSLNFLSMGFQTGGTQSFLLETASPATGGLYQLKFTARARTGLGTPTVEFCKQSVGESSPTVIGSAVSVSATATVAYTTDDTRLAGTSTDYVGPSYTAVAGDRLFVRVNARVATDGNPVFQLFSLNVTNHSRIFTGDMAATANSQYVWSGTQYDSKSIRRARRGLRIISPHTLLSTIIPSGSSTPVNTAEIIAMSTTDTRSIILDPVAVTPSLGVHFSVNLAGNRNPITGTATQAQISLRCLNATSTILSTTTSSAITLNMVAEGGNPPNTVTFNRLYLTLPGDSIPAGTTQVQGVISQFSPQADHGVLATEILITNQGVLPSLVEAPDFFDGSDTGATWAGIANDSASDYNTLRPTSWNIVSGVATPSTEALVSAKASQATGAKVVSIGAPLLAAYAAGSYIFGSEVTAAPEDSTGTRIAGPITLALQFVNSGSVVNTVPLSTLSGSFTGWKTSQGVVTATGFFNEVRLVFTSTTTVHTIIAQVKRVFLYAITGANPIVQKIAVNGVHNPSFLNGGEQWTTTGVITPLTDTTHGTAIRLNTTATAKSNQFPVTTGTTLHTSIWGRSGLQPQVRFYNSSAGVISTVTLTIASSSVYTKVSNTTAVPAAAVNAEIILSNAAGSTASEVAFVYAGADFTGHEQSGYYDPEEFHYFDAAGNDFYDQAAEWVGVPDSSISRVTPRIANGWEFASDVTGANVHLVDFPALRPPESVGSVGAIPRIPKSTSAVYRTTGISRAGNSYLSGQLSIAHQTGLSATVAVYQASTPTGLGTVMWSAPVTVPAGQVMKWADLPITEEFFYVRVTYTENAAAPGYRIFLDNLLLLATNVILGIDYPGYFDGVTGGAGWSGEANKSASTYFGGGRRAYCEVREAIDMTSMAGGTRAEFVVDLEIPGAFWEDMIESNFAFNVTTEQTIAGTEFDLSALLGTTAPIDDAVITVDVSGSLTGLTLTDVATGGWVKYSGALPASITINNGAFTVRNTATQASLITAVTRGGSNVLLPVVPMSSTESPRLKVKADSGTGSLTITVVARRRYVIA